MMMPTPQAQDLYLSTSTGQLYVKRWRVDARDALPKAPIILLHDSLGCVELWRDFPERLAAATHRDVIAYDRLGFGKSSPYVGTLSLDFVLAESRDGFAHVLAQLQLDRFVVMGHSVGGGMAIVVAGDYRNRCGALITESAQTFVEDRTLAGIRATRIAFASDQQMRRLVKYHGEKTRWVFDTWVNTWLSPTFADWNLDREIPRVQCPILAIHGLEDEYGSVAQPQRLAALATAPVTLEYIPACQHVPHREQSKTTLNTIAQFLQTIN